jgi:LmbE family N-acetylglucosaminyl deacetylase
MRDAGADPIESLRVAARGEGRLRDAMWIVAHPDDETVGGGALLAMCDAPWIVHVTDGAPLDHRDGEHAGFPTREAYAQARAIELREALSIANVPRDRAVALGLVDQEASADLARLTGAVANLLVEHAPTTVFTHAYEGGHPDHDAVAFAVHVAAEWMRHGGAVAPLVVEMALYHRAGAEMRTGAFLPRDGFDVIECAFDADRLERKVRQIACFASQRDVLAAFDPRIERFRIAPRYDFAQPPHEGPLLYETWGFAMTGERWRSLACDAMVRLGLVTRRCL